MGLYTNKNIVMDIIFHFCQIHSARAYKKKCSGISLKPKLKAMKPLQKACVNTYNLCESTLIIMQYRVHSNKNNLIN